LFHMLTATPAAMAVRNSDIAVLALRR
jgi:hypothetical protein